MGNRDADQECMNKGCLVNLALQPCSLNTRVSDGWGADRIATIWYQQIRYELSIVCVYVCVGSTDLLAYY